jgi:drug/metabolite transporter (DMT)-like permease
MKLKHWIIFILLGSIWSSSFMWIKMATQEIGPFMLVAFRVMFGLLFGLGVIAIQRAGWPRGRKAWVPLFVIGIVDIAIPFFLISWGETTIDSGIAAILDATVPLFTILIAHYVLHDDKITAPKMAGMLLGFSGVVILLSKDVGDSHSSLLGQGAVILASIFYAASGVYIRKTTEEVPGAWRGTGPLVSATAAMWLATLCFERPLKLPDLTITWIALLWLGVMGSGVALILCFWLIHEIGPTRTSMVTYLFPLGGVILGSSVLHEQLTWQLITGAVLIVASLALANWRTAGSAPSG